MWLISKTFQFEAAHQLPLHDGKCSRLHGHSWRCTVYVSGDKLQCNGAKTGMVADFGDIKRYMEPILDQYLDHHYLNQTLGIENPTSENVARWIYERLFESGLNGLECVEVQETCTCKCLYKPIFP